MRPDFSSFTVLDYYVVLIHNSKYEICFLSIFRLTFVLFVCYDFIDRRGFQTEF